MAKRKKTAHSAPSGYLAGVSARFGYGFSLLNTSDTLVRAGTKGAQKVGGKVLTQVKRAASRVVRTDQVASILGQFLAPTNGKGTVSHSTTKRTRKGAGA